MIAFRFYVKTQQHRDLTMRTLFALGIAVLLVTTGSVAFAAENAVTASDAWVATPAPAAKSADVYMTLHNYSYQDIAVVGSSSPVAERVELNRSALKGQVLDTEPGNKLVIPAGFEMRLQSKGLHYVLLGLKQELHSGDSVDLVLQLDNGSQLDVKAEVVQP
jgi:copper(I)-binding protein